MCSSSIWLPDLQRLELWNTPKSRHGPAACRVSDTRFIVAAIEIKSRLLHDRIWRATFLKWDTSRAETLPLQLTYDCITYSTAEFDRWKWVIEELRSWASTGNENYVRLGCQRVLERSDQARVTLFQLCTLSEGTSKNLCGKAVEAFGNELTNRGVTRLSRLRHRLLRTAQFREI